MKLVPDKLEAFLQFDEIVSVNHAIREKTEEIVQGIESDASKARAIFKWVRDTIPHTKDIEGDIVTCSAIDVFEQGTGICFAKSHLVAVMMRLEGIPCGFCYQLFENDLSSTPNSMALHGLNAVFLESTSQWHKIDPRGNRDDIRGEFSTGDEILAFPAMLFMDDCVYAKPLQSVVDGLREASDIASLWPHLPSIPNA
ncbi:transglutaminase-like domain-containing protein [Rubritalea sp.]|uniref:transglutaminase-like domain-containing protein n=1 Tax=Rubritalea sp. TaxID=2109375 RepID=UPI003EF805DC